MKMSPEHLEALRARIAPLDTPERRARYIAGRYPRAEHTKDLAMRYRWDLFHEVRGYQVWTVLDGYETEHIDTALRRIVPLFETREVVMGRP
ncbi:hypothetical protein SEA_CAFASSO_144 [Gordonia phage Cafasso]|uniref:Uncharacterized protein n=1 Tax=Gordonia phage Cafasso TaxID=2851095 RepID=A0AAE7VCT0_9CAUD|nr:hypothetical protein SEA_CAFASSO_144 [Gordonia phage Cafasso]